MTRFLFVSLPLTGHADWGGMLATARELAAANDSAAAWASGPALADAVTAAGVEFLLLPATGWAQLPPLPSHLTTHERHAQRQQRALDSWLHPTWVLPAVEAVADIIRAWQPDLIVTEPYAAAAALAAERLDLPLIVCGRPALASVAGAPGPAGQRVAALCRAAGVAGRYWDLKVGQISSPLAHLDYFARRWYADLPAVGASSRFLGASPGAFPGTDPTPHSPLVMITLGSLFVEDSSFFRVAATAVLAEGGQPLVVTGQRQADGQPGSALQLPAGTEVANWVDFDRVLPGAAGVIHHGGVGTTHAALRHGTPQVAVPRAGDQIAQAGRITQAGVGYGVRPADFTPPSARWFARQLLQNDALHSQALDWRAELRALGGPAAAAYVLRSLQVA